MAQNESAYIKNNEADIRIISLPTLPRSPEQLRSLPCFDILDPFKTAACAVAALCEYGRDTEASVAMINLLKGSDQLSEHDKHFLSDRFAGGKDYIPRSYLGGAAPDNGYTPSEPITVTVSELPDSRREAGYIDMYVTSGGADAPRPVRLRQKPSTGEWFLWSFSALLSGIRVPRQRLD